MPDPDHKQAVAGCAMVLALLCTIGLGIAWAMSSKADSQHYMLMFVIGAVITAVLGKQVEAGEKK